MRYSLVLGLVPIILSACTETYHPEYHPVTVTNSSQNMSYPVTVRSGGAPPGAPGVTIVQGSPDQ